METRGGGSTVIPWCAWVLLTFGCIPAALAAGMPGVWKTYTSKKEVRDLVVRNGVVWAATTGGMFSLAVQETSFQEFTTSEGLRTNDLSAVTIDGTGAVWTGGSNGFLHAFFPLQRQWRYVTDIFRDSSPQKRISILAAYGDTLYVGSEIGLSVYNISRDEFLYTARSFGSPVTISGTVTGVALFHDTLWVGTASGIASAPRSSANLAAPDSWRVWGPPDGLPSSSITSLASTGDTLYASTTQGVALYAGGVWTSVASTSGMNVLKIASQPALLYFITSFEVFSLDAGNVTSIGSSFGSVLNSLSVDGIQVVVGSDDDGVYVRTGGTWTALVPKGAPTNRFAGIAVDQNGVLWAGTGISPGDGFMSFDGKDWRGFSYLTTPVLGSNTYYKANIGGGNTKWISSWGTGVALLDAQDSLRKVFNTGNGLPPTAPFQRPFVVVAGVQADNNGRTWICVRTGNGDTSFVVVNPDSNLTYVVGPPRSLGLFPWIGEFVIDQYGTKWVANSRLVPGAGNQNGAVFGMYFYNERGFPGGDTSKWGQITVASGLLSDRIYTIAVDMTGQIWAGADTGISIILNPYGLRPQIASYYPLRDQIINAIAVDPLNNKWIATTQGVFVLSPDGTSILTQYTQENTDGKLIDNNVTSLAIDSKSGTVYFGTDRGLSSLTTTAAAPLRSFDGLDVSPNPFYIPGNSTLTIDGLVQNSVLKILSINGDVVNELKTPGGRVGFWDGRDLRGNLVSSGVYIIVAFSENGSQVAAGKVAVLRR